MQLRVEYVADFHPSTFMPVLAHKYLLVPNPKEDKDAPDLSSDLKETLPHVFGYEKFVKNVSEWLLVDKHFFDMSGLHCNKIGVSYTAFKHQPARCSSKAQVLVYFHCYNLLPVDLPGIIVLILQLSPKPAS